MVCINTLKISVAERIESDVYQAAKHWLIDNDMYEAPVISSSSEEIGELHTWNGTAYTQELLDKEFGPVFKVEFLRDNRS